MQLLRHLRKYSKQGVEENMAASYEGSGAQEDAALLLQQLGERGKRAGGKIRKRAKGSSLQLGIRQDLGRLGRYKKNLRGVFSGIKTRVHLAVAFSCLEAV